MAFFFSLVVLGALVKILGVWQVLALGSNESFSPANQNENKTKIKKKNKKIKSMKNIFAVIKDELQQPEGIYIVLV